MQNFISSLVVIVLGLCGAVSVEKLNWKLIKVWIPVNLIFIGMLVSGMYRYVLKGNIVFASSASRYVQSNAWISALRCFNGRHNRKSIICTLKILETFLREIYHHIIEPWIFLVNIFSLKCINIAMVTILKNMTNILTAIGEFYLFRKRQNHKVWTAMFLMVFSFFLAAQVFEAVVSSYDFVMKLFVALFFWNMKMLKCITNLFQQARLSVFLNYQFFACCLRDLFILFITL